MNLSRGAVSLIVFILSIPCPPYLFANAGTISDTVIVVTSTYPSQQLRYVTSSVEVVDKRDMKGSRKHYLDDVLLFVPGLHVQSRHNQDEARISIRGSGIRTNWGVRGINVLINGIPLTDPDGLTDIDAIDLATVERVEVLRGPASALYGSGAVGGALNFILTVIPEPFSARAESRLGSYGFQRHSIQIGGAHSLYNYAVSFSHHRKEGYREQSGGNSQRFYGVFSLHPDNRTNMNFMALWRRISFDLPGSLTEEEFRNNPKQASEGAIEGGWRKEKTRSRFAFQLEREITTALTVESSLYYGENATPYHPIFMVLEEDYRAFGTDGRILYAGRIGRISMRLVTGGEYRQINGGARYYLNVGGDRGELNRNEHVNVTKSGIYLHQEFIPSAKWIFTVGGRYDIIRYLFDDLIDEDSYSNEFRRFTPTAGVAYEAHRRIVLHAGVSTGFESPAITELRGADFTLSPIHSVSFETGVRVDLLNETHLNVSAYSMKLIDDIIPYTIGFQTKYRNADATRHNGVDASLRMNPVESISIRAAYTYSDFRFVEDEEYSGNRIPGIPVHRAAFGIGLLTPLGIVTGTRIEWNDSFYLNDANSNSHPAYRVISVYMEYRWNMVTLYSSVENVFDTKYASFVRINENAERYFEPGDGRGYFIGISVRY